jgi:hypothetical protein
MKTKLLIPPALILTVLAIAVRSQLPTTPLPYNPFQQMAVDAIHWKYAGVNILEVTDERLLQDHANAQYWEALCDDHPCFLYVRWETTGVRKAAMFLVNQDPKWTDEVPLELNDWTETVQKHRAIPHRTLAELQSIKQKQDEQRQYEELLRRERQQREYLQREHDLFRNLQRSPNNDPRRHNAMRTLTG